MSEDGGSAGGNGAPRGRRRRRRSDLKQQPGGTAAILGVQLLRFSGVQGASLTITNLLHYGSIVAVGAILGATRLGGYSLLLFLTGLVTAVIHLATKPGTIRRVFGQGDEDDEDDDEEEDLTDVSSNPPWTLGVGLAFCLLLSSAFIALAVVFRSEIAGVLLHDSTQGRLVIWAAITAGMLSVYRLAELALWFEQRPGAFLVADISRPTLNLAFIIVLCTAGGMGLEGAVLGPAIGTTAATLVTIVLLRKSFVVAFSASEAWEILKLSKNRVPVIASMWVIQNADTFILSRYVDNHDVGIYQLASRTGLVVALLPQGFRVALRPLRRGTAYLSMKKQYGAQVAQGQILAYFFLLCITSVLAMFLLGETLVHDATGDFAKAAGLIPLAAGAMTMPALFRTVNSMVLVPRGRKVFIVGIVFVAIAYIGLAMLIVPRIGIYGPPTAILCAFGAPLTYVSLRSQLSDKPIQVPYLSLLRAFAVAVAIGAFFELVHPHGRWPQLVEVAALMGVWFAALFALRIVPEHHRRPLWHVARSALRGSAVRFQPGRGLRSLKPEQRDALRPAVAGLPPERIEPRGERLVRLLRKAGQAGLAPVGPPTSLDGPLALYLFSDEPGSTRQARLRALIANGADSEDVRVLEEVIQQLAKAPPELWEGRRRRVGRLSGARLVRRARGRGAAGAPTPRPPRSRPSPSAGSRSGQGRS